VPILEFRGSTEDTELLDVIPFLEGLSKAEDVRTVLQ
jgi:TFIIF-interacting CTD phosphatase-like protein